MAKIAGHKPQRAKVAHITPSGRARSERMIERSANTRALIIRCAGSIIGRYGYAGCSIARVTAKAKIAHGTFYLYFSSQQALFDEVLPSSQAAMLATIADAIREAKNVYELEERGLRANFAYLKKHPYLYRVMTEAQVYAPKAFAYHLEVINKRYSRAMRRLIFGTNPVDERTAARFETVAAMLEGARTGLLVRFGLDGHKIIGLSEETFKIYLEFVSAGLATLFPGTQKCER